MSDELAKLLRQSPFGSLQEARRFLHWYRRHEARSAWDKERAELAEELLAAFAKEPPSTDSATPNALEGE